MKKVRIAIIGANLFSHATGIVLSLGYLKNVFEIVGYTLPENEREKYPNAVKYYEKYREMTLDEILSDPSIEAVAVETDEIYLTKYAILAAKSGKHIHMEKPGGLCLAEFEELIAEVKRSGKVFHTGYMYRYNPVIRDAIKKAKEGELGDVLTVEAQMSIYHDNATRSYLSNFPGGMTYYLGCHLIDLILQIKGEPLKIHPFTRASGKDGIGSRDLGMVLFEYESGISFAKMYSTEASGFARRQLVISGSKAMIEIKPLELVDDVENVGIQPQHTEMREYVGTHRYRDLPEVVSCESFCRYGVMMEGFAELVRGERENPYTPDYELLLYRTLLKACE